MRAVDQWAAIEAELGAAWDAVRLSFVVEDAEAIADAASVLGPLGPGRVGSELRFLVARDAGETAKLENLLRHLDRKRVWGTLGLVDVRREKPAEREDEPEPTPLLAESWDAAISRLPAGWRDLLCELRLDSTDFLARAALLGSPLNPTRTPDAIALRFRASSGGGYGTASTMVRRCFERMDAEGITGRVVVLNELSDTENVATQGPVWRVSGRSV